jgi:hypothetical protein
MANDPALERYKAAQRSPKKYPTEEEVNRELARARRGDPVLDRYRAIARLGGNPTDEEIEAEVRRGAPPPVIVVAPFGSNMGGTSASPEQLYAPPQWAVPGAPALAPQPAPVQGLMASTIPQTGAQRVAEMWPAPPPVQAAPAQAGLMGAGARADIQRRQALGQALHSPKLGAALAADRAEQTLAQERVNEASRTFSASMEDRARAQTLYELNHMLQGVDTATLMQAVEALKKKKTAEQAQTSSMVPYRPSDQDVARAAAIQQAGAPNVDPRRRPVMQGLGGGDRAWQQAEESLAADLLRYGY